MTKQATTKAAKTCGCYIDGHIWLIEFCPLHREAPAMLALLREFVASLEGAYDGDVNYMDQQLPDNHPWRGASALFARLDSGA